MINKIKNRLASEQGFTLIELLVVIVILGILVAIAVPSYLSFRGNAQDAAAKSNVRSAIPAAESFYQTVEPNSYTGLDRRGAPHPGTRRLAERQGGRAEQRRTATASRTPRPQATSSTTSAARPERVTGRARRRSRRRPASHERRRNRSLRRPAIPT